VNLPVAWTTAPFAFDEAAGRFIRTGAFLNVPAIFVTMLATIILVIGIKESARFNGVIVYVKIVVVLLFIAVGVRYVHKENWHPFIPPNEGPGRFGFSGIMRGASAVFFAYIGFDAVSTAAQECKNPQKDLPTGILGSLAICTVLYIAASLVLTGVVPFSQLSVPHPVAFGAEAMGLKWLALAVEVGAIAGLSSVMIVMLMGQPRVFFSMALDGLFPKFATKVHPRFGTPYITTIITGVVCAMAGGLLPIGVLGHLVSIGTLFAFVLVCIGVWILRVRDPNAPRQFKTPLVPLVPILGIVANGAMIFGLGWTNWLRLAVWLVIGLIIYFAYSQKHSRLPG
jgi:APA family basic amino acid/polyamine antiporter